MAMNTLGFLVRLGRNEKAIALVIVLLAAISSRAETNSWTKPTSGVWQEETSWSLGILPDVEQSVAITNSDEKTVTINLETAQNFPASLTVNNITTSGGNTLRLDHVGTNVPLQAINGLPYTSGSSDLALAKDATLMNIGSGLIIGTNGGHGLRSSGTILQDGGFIDLRSPGYVGGKCLLLNGLFTAAGFFDFSGIFDQFGGNARFGDLELGGTYNFYGGAFSSGVLYMGRWATPASFTQQSGTNQIGSLTMSPPCCSAPQLRFFLNGGFLYVGRVALGPGSAFSHDGAVVVITNTLQIQGTILGHFGESPAPASYQFKSGVLSAQDVIIGRSLSSYSQGGGTTSISGSLQFFSNGGSDRPGSLYLSGGMLNCASVSNNAGAVNILQTGGDFVVSNLFSFVGYYAYYPCYYCSTQTVGFASYNFSGGSLYASNIELAAEMIIGSSTQVGRITNPGYFKMSGTLTVGDAMEQLGRFILASNSIINLGNGFAKLSFANSSAEAWDGAATLFVTNWNGFSGGDKLRFGNDQSGVTASQLAQIRFVNPVGFPPGEFFAQILETGEVVPKPRPTLALSQNGTNFVLNWTSDFILQTATNVSGPYEDVPTAISPYTNEVTENSQHFFRLRK
jgi:hypothetical protein